VADNDKGQSQSKQQKAQGKAQSEQGGNQADGAALEALEQAKSRARAQFADVNDDYVAEDWEAAQEKGYLGYSPTGPGENDAPWGRSESSRLGTLGEFSEGK
jgi:hypothetical protein